MATTVKFHNIGLQPSLFDSAVAIKALLCMANHDLQSQSALGADNINAMTLDELDSGYTRPTVTRSGSAADDVNNWWLEKVQNDEVDFGTVNPGTRAVRGVLYYFQVDSPEDDATSTPYMSVVYDEDQVPTGGSLKISLPSGLVRYFEKDTQG